MEEYGNLSQRPWIPVLGQEKMACERVYTDYMRTLDKFITFICTWRIILEQSYRVLHYYS